MANTALQFSFEANQIRVVVGNDGEPWFCAKDVCEILGYERPNDAVRAHVPEKGTAKHRTLTNGGHQDLLHINEAGLYRLIMKCALPQAEAFIAWVAEEVLPSIRRTGNYSQPSAIPHQSLCAFEPPPETAAKLATADYARGMLLSIPGMHATTVVAYALDFLETATGLPLRVMSRALPSESQVMIDTLNPTQVGEILEMSARDVNSALAEIGLQTRINNKWVLTDAGQEHGAATPFVRNGHSGYEIRWRRSVVDVLQQLLAEADI